MCVLNHSDFIVISHGTWLSSGGRSKNCTNKTTGKQLEFSCIMSHNIQLCAYQINNDDITSPWLVHV